MLGQFGDLNLSVWSISGVNAHVVLLQLTLHLFMLGQSLQSSAFQNK